MRLLLVVVAVSLIGCGPASQFDAQRGTSVGTSVDAGPAPGVAKLKAEIRNEYAESVFTMTANVYAANDGGWVSTTDLFDAVRIGSYETKTVDLQANVGEVIGVTFSGTSLGRVHAFQELKVAPVSVEKRTLFVLYDYDIALAEFRARIGWR